MGAENKTTNDLSSKLHHPRMSSYKVTFTCYNGHTRTKEYYRPRKLGCIQGLRTIKCPSCGDYMDGKTTEVTLWHYDDDGHTIYTGEY